MFGLTSAEIAAIVTVIGTIVVAFSQGWWKNREIKDLAKNNISARFYDDQAKEMEYLRKELKDVRVDCDLKDEKILACTSEARELKFKLQMLERQLAN